ncbi:unnamed protein product [Blepharisma stoltei]|uniref:Sperm-associated antigen 17 n=1 Tax=Blepharisma stoltei TaxID=1481888 RepID=A0AAU9JWM1_9CILI|nr:unnamed protein product [Blepharisma stoltei]
MPPKKKEEKKQEEVIDNSTLPKCKTWIFTIYLHPYFTKLHQILKIQDLRVISKEDLLNYIKEKSLDKTPENLAKACRAKLDEIELPFRKERKDPPKATESPKKDKDKIVTPIATPRPDDKFDVTVYFKNFPQSKEEVTELIKVGINIDLCYYVKPSQSYIQSKLEAKMKSYREKREEVRAAGAMESLLQIPTQPDDYPEGFMELQNLSWSPKNQDSKHLIWKIIEFKTEEDLEVKEEIKEEVKEEQQTKSRKDLKPSSKKAEENKEDEANANDPKVKLCDGIIREIKQISSAKLEYEKWQASVKVNSLYSERAEQFDAPPELSDIHSVGSPIKHVGSLADTLDKFMVPEPFTIDDLTKPWDLSYFNHIINVGKEQSKTVNYLVACFLKQIMKEKGGTMDEEKQLDSFINTKKYESQLSYASKIEDIQDRPKTAHKIGIQDSMMIVDYNDKIAKLSLREHFAQSNIEIKEMIKLFKENIELPIFGESLKAQSASPSIRLANYNEVLSFSSIPRKEFERALLLLDFEKLMKSIQPERDWNFSDRVYEENFSLSLLQQTLDSLIPQDPEVIYEYNSLRDCTLLCVFFKTPPGRLIRRLWKSPWRVRPNFPQYLETFADKTLNSFLDVDASLVGSIKERIKIMYPADNSLMKMTEYFIGPRNLLESRELFETPRHRAVVYKDNWIFGIRKDKSKCGEFWAVHEDEKILVEKEIDGCSLSITLNNGLIVKILPTGEILQQKCKGKEDPCKEEENRIIGGMGYVVRNLVNDAIQILMPSGDFSTRSKDRVWVCTNNKGMRLVKRMKDGVSYNLEPIKVQSFTDPETLAKVIIREDLVMKITFSDNSYAAFHPDGTKIHTSADENTVHIESPGYAPVKSHKDPLKARQHTVIGLGSSDSGLGIGDLMLRSHNGIITEVILPNKTSIRTFTQKQEMEGYNEYCTQLICVLTTSDGSIMKVQQDGEIVLITGEARQILAEKDGQDAYFYELFTLAEDRTSGVYSAHCEKGKIWTKDSEGNYFEIGIQGKAIEKLAVSLNVEEAEPTTPRIAEGEYIDPECRFLPPPLTIIQPRLFEIKGNKVKELLNEEQLTPFKRNLDWSYKKQGEDCHTWIKSLEGKDNYLHPTSPFKYYSIPKTVSSILQTIIIPDEPVNSAYINRTIYEFPSFDEEKRLKVSDDLKRYEEWKEKQKKTRSTYAIQDSRTEAAKEKEKEILQRIADMRGENSKIGSFKETDIKESTEEDIQFEFEETPYQEEEFKIVIEDEVE